MGTVGAGGAPLLTVAADLPLLDGAAVNAVLDAARTADGDSLTVCVPAARKRELGVSADATTEIDGREVVPAGINVVGGSDIRTGRRRGFDRRPRRRRPPHRRRRPTRRQRQLPVGRADRRATEQRFNGIPHRPMNLDTALDLEREPHGSSDDPDPLDFSANINPEVPPGVEEAYREAFAAARSYPVEPPESFRGRRRVRRLRPDAVVPTPVDSPRSARRSRSRSSIRGDTALIPAPSFGEYAPRGATAGRRARLRRCRRGPRRRPGGPRARGRLRPEQPHGDRLRARGAGGFAARCRAADTLLLVDEAFRGFTDRPSLAGGGPSSPGR